MKGQELRDKLKRAGRKTQHCLEEAAWQSCKCALWICCAPCICLAVIFIPRRRCGNEGKRIRYIQPEIPFPRERAMTIPCEEWRENQTTLDQPQSDFMVKLPLEIRRMIYERALGGASIHAMTTMHGKLHARRCPLDECRCSILGWTGERNLNFALSLLRTCRIM